jgi:hypothetical protein
MPGFIYGGAGGIVTLSGNAGKKEPQMEKAQVYVIYDTDNDFDLLDLLAAQAGEPESHFEISDWTGNKATCENAGIMERLSMVNSVIVICGELTHASETVGDELTAAQQLDKPYILLWGRKGRLVSAPASALPTDNLHEWTWAVLEGQLKKV